MSETPDPGAQPRASAPWWVPEFRVIVAAVLFGLAWRVLEMLGANPDLSKNTLFVAIATGLFGGSGILAITGFYYMASKKDGQNGGVQ